MEDRTGSSFKRDLRCRSDIVSLCIRERKRVFEREGGEGEEREREREREREQWGMRESVVTSWAVQKGSICLVDGGKETM
jgi:hypothetical protein